MHVGYAFKINMKERWHIVDQCNFGLSISRNIEITSLLKECIIIKTFWLLICLFNFFWFIDYHVNHWFNENIYFILLMLIGKFHQNSLLWFSMKHNKHIWGHRWPACKKYKHCKGFPLIPISSSSWKSYSMFFPPF